MTERETASIAGTENDNSDNSDNSENLIQEFKSYPDMCRRLNLEIKTGGAKQNQMKDLGKRFHLEIKRQKITLRGRGKEEIERCEREEWETLYIDLYFSYSSSFFFLSPL